MKIIKKTSNKLNRTLFDLVLEIGKKKGYIYSNRIIYNLNYNPSNKQKIVLFCYLNYTEASIKLSSGVTHTNQPRFFEMLSCFYKMNYIVDACYCNDVAAIKELNFSRYDYIVGFGKVFEAACANKHCNAKKIIYMTEDPYKIAKQKEEERISYFLIRSKNLKTQRTLYDFANTRAGFFYLPGQEEKADYIISQGNLEYFKNLDIPLFSITPNAFKNKSYKNKQENKIEKTFIMFGASSLIRKGTDLLIDVFTKHLDWQLYLCDHYITENLKKLGYKFLPPNVIDCGFIDIESTQLVELFQKCRFIILPSCTEAPSSAVLTGMRHGLIPIVSSGIGLDKFSEYCYYFKDYHLNEIEKTIEEICLIPKYKLEKQSNAIYKYANQMFTLKKYGEDFFKILCEIEQNL